MRYLVAEKGMGLAILIFAFGIFLFMDASLFARPVLLSEKSLLLLFAGSGLIVSSVFVAFRSFKKVGSK